MLLCCCAVVHAPIRFGLAGLYRPGLPLVHTCTQVLTSLLAHSHPELFRHMHVQLGVSPAQFAPQWLMSAFISRYADRFMCAFVS